MADGVPVTPGVGTTIATDDVAGVQYQVVKLDVGADGVASGPVSASNPLPVGGTAIGALGEAAPGTDTASSGLNGRLQRIAQRITSLMALLPSALTGSGNLKVAIVEDTVGSILDADNAAKVTLNSKYIAVGATDCVPKFAVISCASSGANTIVASVSSKKIRVLAYNFIANGTVSAKFQSGAGGTNLTGLKYCVANMGICAPFNPAGWFETAATTLLSLDLSGNIAVGGELVYIEV